MSLQNRNYALKPFRKHWTLAQNGEAHENGQGVRGEGDMGVVKAVVTNSMDAKNTKGVCSLSSLARGY